MSNTMKAGDNFTGAVIIIRQHNITTFVSGMFGESDTIDFHRAMKFLCSGDAIKYIIKNNCALNHYIVREYLDGKEFREYVAGNVNAWGEFMNMPAGALSVCGRRVIGAELVPEYEELAPIEIAHPQNIWRSRWV